MENTIVTISNKSELARFIARGILLVVNGGLYRRHTINSTTWLRHVAGDSTHDWWQVGYPATDAAIEASKGEPVPSVRLPLRLG